jgi:hypothetical protein
VFRDDHVGADVNIGAYVAIGLSARGLAGALLMLPRKTAAAVRVDRNGNIVRADR